MKIRSTFALLLAISLVFSVVGCGGKKEPPKPSTLEFEHFVKAKGLPEEKITSLAAFGNKVWAGSENGLFCYDGVNWQIHQRKNTNVLGSNIIEDLKVLDNAIWIATDNGACKFNGTNWSSVYTGGRARSVVGRGAEIAVATAYGVVYSRGGASKALGKDNAGLIMDEVNQVVFDGNGQLWAGTRAGMAKLTSEMFQNFTGPAKSVMGSSLIDVPASPANCQLPGNNIKVILPFGNMLAIGTTTGLSVTDMAGNYTNYKAEHRDWFQRGGEIVEEKVPGNSPIPGNIINALAVTERGEMLFVGTDKGLAILHGTNWLKIDELIPGLPKYAVNGLAYLRGDLWMATNSGIFQIKKIDSLLTPADQSN